MEERALTAASAAELGEMRTSRSGELAGARKYSASTLGAQSSGRRAIMNLAAVNHSLK